MEYTLCVMSCKFIHSIIMQFFVVRLSYSSVSFISLSRDFLLLCDPEGCLPILLHHLELYIYTAQ